MGRYLTVINSAEDIAQKLGLTTEIVNGLCEYGILKEAEPGHEEGPCGKIVSRESARRFMEEMSSDVVMKSMVDAIGTAFAQKDAAESSIHRLSAALASIRSHVVPK